MAKRSLPTSATGTLDIEALLAFHRSAFGDARMEGQPSPPAPPAPAPMPAFVPPPAPAPAPAPIPTPAAPARGEHEGFDYPDGTPVADMTPAQQTEYWRYHSQKHEKLWKTADVSPQEIEQLRAKADRHDALERELMSDKDKAVAEAKDSAKAEALAAVAPKLVGAEFKAALKGRVPDDQITSRLEAILEPLDVSKFLTDTGDVDTDKVAKFVDGIAPATDATTVRRGPSPHGQGVRSGSTASGNSVAAGRERYQNRNARTSTTTT